MIDMGAMQGAFLRGWQQVCAEDLGIHRITLRRATKVLIAKGILQEFRRGTAGFIPEAFESEADPGRIKIIREGAKAC
jgi:DNA-binding transcriptional regulator YhcF (GntR family)